MFKKAVFIAFIAAVGSSFAQLGVFEAEGEVGNCKTKGKVVYDSTTKEYAVSGAGVNVFHVDDQCHFVWKKMAGDFFVRTRSKGYVKQAADPDKWCKTGWMARKDITHDCAYVGTGLHPSGLVTLIDRPTTGAQTDEVQDSLKVTNATPNIMQLHRKGTTYIMGIAIEGSAMHFDTVKNVELGAEPLYVGLYVCSHNENLLETFVYDNVYMGAGEPTSIAVVGNDFAPTRTIAIKSLIRTPELFSSVTVINGLGQDIIAGEPALFSSMIKRLGSGIYYVKARAVNGETYNLKFVRE
jgi:TolB protein